MERVSSFVVVVLCLLGFAYSVTITVDGNPTDWPGNPGCSVGNLTCTKVADDPVESAQAGVPEEIVQPQWDIISLWYTEDTTRGYIRFDTIVDIQLTAVTYLKICLDIPSIPGGVAVSGCLNQLTNTLIYVARIGGAPAVRILNCSAVTCTGSPRTSWANNPAGTVSMNGNVTEISYLLSDASTPANSNTTVGVYFDNGDIAADDYIVGVSLKPAPIEEPECVEGVTINIDGTDGDWPSDTSLSADVLESLNTGGNEFPVQAQWDISEVFATDDGTFGYVRWDTRNPTVYGTAPFVKVCLSTPNITNNGQNNVPGCGLTDTLIYVFEDDQITHHLTARVFDCNIVECIGQPSDLIGFTTTSAAYSGRSSEVRYPLSFVPLGAGVAPRVVVYFDNSDVYADDRVPDAGFLTYEIDTCPVDCEGVTNGNKTYDVCGVCGGSDTNPLNCIPDCLGVKGGSAVYDSCGVCDGDGFSCVCKSEVTITVDGNPLDWPVEARISVDPRESSLIDVQPQSDILELYAYDDGTNAFIRFDTYANTTYGASEHVKICLSYPDLPGGVAVPGCSGLQVDALLYIARVGANLVARLIDCNAQNCAAPGGVTTYTTGTVVNSGKVTEASFPLSHLPSYTAGIHSEIVVSFDNGVAASDDRVPDSGTADYDFFNCTADCFGVLGGFAVYDACGVCDGNGESCLCAVDAPDVVVDGVGDEWIGGGITEFDDVQESLNPTGAENPVEPQWDITTLYLSDDAVTLSVRWDTVDEVEYGASEIVKICVSLPNVTLGDFVPGCGNAASGFYVDSLLVVQMPNKTTGELVATVYDCRVQDCGLNPGLLSGGVRVDAAFAGHTTEVSAPLSFLRLSSTVKPRVVVYFDNGDTAADDRVPDNSFLTYEPFVCKEDCFGVKGGNATYDACGVCDGNGESCLCFDLGTDVVADGIVDEWPGEDVVGGCVVGHKLCSKIADDIAESQLSDLSDPALRIQPEWDLVSLWAVNSKTQGAFRFDTYANTDWSDGVFVRICIDVPGVSPGAAVRGCEGLATDAMIFITAVDAAGDELNATLVNCNVQNCDIYPAIHADHKPVQAEYDGVHTEVTFNLADVPGLLSSDRTNVKVYFDNNGQPADDLISLVEWPVTQCVPDCFGYLGGLAKYDACGICDGDGQSCLCTSDVDITVDGSDEDWEGAFGCSPLTTGCSKIGVDVAESTLSASPNAVQAQWDLINLWAADDYVDLYLRFDTHASTWYNTSEFARICLDVPSVSSGKQTPGCGNLPETDFVVFITSNNNGIALIANLLSCADTDDCSLQFNWEDSQPVPVEYHAKTTEVSVRMDWIEVSPGDDIHISVFFDNGQTPTDDNLPDTGYFTYEAEECVQDCFGVYGGTAVRDKCGVCGGDGTGCECANHTDIVLSGGFVSNWGTPCTPGSFHCKLAVEDDDESSANQPYGIQSEWDIINVWATNDGLKEYIRIDTLATTEWTHQEFIRVCLDVPSAGPGQDIDGCEGLATDFVIFVQAVAPDSNTLAAALIDCNLPGNNCHRPPAQNSLTETVAVTWSGTTTQIAFYLLSVRIFDASDISAIVYFDNNDLPADDQALITIHPDPCVMHPCGNYQLVSYTTDADHDSEDLVVVGSVQLRRDQFPATSWVVSIWSAYDVRSVEVQLANELIDFPTSDNGDRLVPSLFEDIEDYSSNPRRNPNVVISDSADYDLISVHTWLKHPRTGQIIQAWAYGIQWREGCPCFPGFIAYTHCDDKK